MSAPKKTDLTIVIPALNESEIIAMTLDEVKRVLEKARISHQIIVVDDASIDGTGLVAGEHGADVVVKTKHTVGKGAAIRLGASKASGSIIVTLDADGAYNPMDIGKLLAPILEGRADLVIGSRLIPYHEKFMSKFGSILISIILRFCLGIEFFDIWSGLKAYRANILHSLLKYPLSSGHLFDSEIAILAKERGYRVSEIPVRIRLRESFGYSRSKFVVGLRNFLSLYTIIIHLGKYG